VATKEELDAFLRAEFPESRCVVEQVGDRGATVSLQVGHADRRPGGTVAGPVLMAVADVALYVAVLGEIGIVPLAVTTSLTINFLRRPRAEGRVVGVCNLLKVGRSLAVGEVSVYSDATEGVVAHVVGTYSIPPDAARSRRTPEGSEGA
jgi:uncharacterized protein (TIGR00369 family)